VVGGRTDSRRKVLSQSALITDAPPSVRLVVLPFLHDGFVDAGFANPSATDIPSAFDAAGHFAPGSNAVLSEPNGLSSGMH
jgi:hypothetical protein